MSHDLTLRNGILSLSTLALVACGGGDSGGAASSPSGSGGGSGGGVTVQPDFRTKLETPQDVGLFLSLAGFGSTVENQAD